MYKRQPQDVTDVLVKRAEAVCADKEKRWGSQLMREFERVVLLRNVDMKLSLIHI